VNVIALRTLRAFWEKHPEAETSLRAWYKLLVKTELQSFNVLKDTFNSADYSDLYTIFDVGGDPSPKGAGVGSRSNNYRVIVVMVYAGRAAFIKAVFTHVEYTKWNDRRRKGKA
jgi:mRNA interferase HigB